MIYESQRQRVARGKDLGVTRAQNKGGVGFAFRYYDTAFGVCCSHLASDNKGRCVGLQYVFVLDACGMKLSARLSLLLFSTGPSCANACAMPVTFCP